MTSLDSWAPTPSVPWTAADWHLDLRGDEFADVRHGDGAVLRAVSAVVRDADWNTVRFIVDERTIDASGILLRVRTDSSALPLTGTVSVTTEGDELVFHLDLEASRTLHTCRIGFVVLHPPGLSGRSLQVDHPDGQTTATCFPERISPHQPARDITGLRWPSPVGRMHLAFSGDVFEMEDQRNWTDASFKTYSRPLDLPFPYAVAQGEHITQTVRLRRSPGADAGETADPRDIELRAGGRVPAFSLTASTAPDPVPETPPIGETLLVELDLDEPAWRSALHRAASTGLRLDLRLLADDPARTLTELALEIRDLPVDAVALFDRERHVTLTDDARMLSDALERVGLAPRVLRGSRSHFTELNREHAALAPGTSGVVFTVTPQFHSTTTEQVIESVPIQRLLAEQAVADAGGAPVMIGPIVLRPRFNDVATVRQTCATRADLADGYGAQFTGQIDPRLDTAPAAAWTIASAAALAIPGVSRVTYFEEWGPRGIHSSDGGAKPVATALRALAAMTGSPLSTGRTADALVWAIEGDALLLANLDRVDRSVRVRGPRDSRSVSVTVPPLGWLQIDRP